MIDRDRVLVVLGLAGALAGAALTMAAAFGDDHAGANAPLGVPQFREPVASTRIDREAYCVEYDHARQAPRWVAYRLDVGDIGGCDRADFRTDLDLAGAVGDDHDYEYSGWDRGHMRPAGASCGSATETEQAGMWANIAPMDPALNRGRWRSLESHLQGLVEIEWQVYVTMGPAYLQGLGEFGEGVDAPSHYWALAYWRSGGRWLAEAWILPNDECESPLEMYMIKPDALDAILEADLIPGLK